MVCFCDYRAVFSANLDSNDSKYTQEIGLRFGILKKAVSPSSIGPFDVTESVHWYESRNSDRPVHV